MEAEQLYKWILVVSEARERLDLPVGLIEEAMAAPQTAFGTSYLAGLIPSDQDSGKRAGTARDDKPLSYWLLDCCHQRFIVLLYATSGR